MIKKNYTPIELQELLKQAHYHLGCVLYQGEIDFDRAVSELETAVQMDPDNIPALYHLGQAIREQVERSTLKRAEDVLRTYLLKGAPLGDEDRIREFLGSRSKSIGM